MSTGGWRAWSRAGRARKDGALRAPASAPWSGVFRRVIWGSAERRHQRPRRPRCSLLVTRPSTPDTSSSQYEVRARHTVHAGQQDGEFSVEIRIGAAHQQMPDSVEPELPYRARFVERIAAEQKSIVTGKIDVRIDPRKIDPVSLASIEIHDSVAHAADV